MRVKVSVELAPYYVPFMSAATSIHAISAAKPVTVVYKEIYSAHTNYICNKDATPPYLP